MCVWPRRAKPKGSDCATSRTVGIHAGDSARFVLHQSVSHAGHVVHLTGCTPSCGVQAVVLLAFVPWLLYYGFVRVFLLGARSVGKCLRSMYRTGCCQGIKDGIACICTGIGNGIVCVAKLLW